MRVNRRGEMGGVEGVEGGLIRGVEGVEGVERGVRCGWRGLGRVSLGFVKLGKIEIELGGGGGGNIQLLL